MNPQTDRCRLCHAVELTVGADKLKRYSCRKGHPMHDHCGYFTALPNQREAVVAKPIAGQADPDCQLDIHGEKS